MGELVGVGTAAKLLGVSPSYIYKLRCTAPGIYAFGKGLRINPAELAAWARTQAEQKATEPKRRRPRKAASKDAA